MQKGGYPLLLLKGERSIVPVAVEELDLRHWRPTSTEHRPRTLATGVEWGRGVLRGEVRVEMIDTLNNTILHTLGLQSYRT